jgi:hypothetical protein
MTHGRLGQRVLDMQAALSELSAIYEECRAQDLGLIPAIDWFPPERQQGVRLVEQRKPLSSSFYIMHRPEL